MRLEIMIPPQASSLPGRLAACIHTNNNRNFQDASKISRSVGNAENYQIPLWPLAPRADPALHAPDDDVVMLPVLPLDTTLTLSLGRAQ